MDAPSIEAIQEEVLKILFWRMKNDPASIKTSELVPFATQVLRALEVKGNKAKTSLQDILGQISDASTNS